MNLADITTKQGEGINGYVTNFSSGGISHPEMVGLQQLIEKVAHQGLRCADVGVAKGCSSAAMAFKVKEYNGHVYSIDDYRAWKVHVDQWAQAKCSDIFLNNMKYLGLDKDITLLEVSSEEGSKQFEDAYFDLVFLDASHNYNEVIKDIKHWSPKVRSGGIICGHDCQLMTKDGKVDIRPWQNVSGETTGYDQQDFSWHVGVMLAVGDMFPNAQVFPNTTIWWIQL